MTHPTFVAVAYVLGIGIPIAYALAAWQRTVAARRKLAAIDPRGQRL
jgi:cytochrome c biogenesis protein CcdA